jgi:hypothetical protein
MQGCHFAVGFLAYASDMSMLGLHLHQGLGGIDRAGGGQVHQARCAHASTQSMHHAWKFGYKIHGVFIE